MNAGDDSKGARGHLLAKVSATVLAWLASPAGFVVAVALTVLRHFVAPLFLDFHDGLYYPTQAFLTGDDPYGAGYLAAYPVQSPFPYPPHALLLFLPFALPRYPVAAALYFVVGVAAILAIAWLSVRLAELPDGSTWFWGTATALLLSRPGHMAVVQGQPSLLVLVAALAALSLTGRSWTASLALAVTTIKPTFGAPLLAITVARGDWPQAVRATVLAGALALYPIVTLVTRAGGPTSFMTSLGMNQSRWLLNQDNDPVSSVYRVDVSALVSRMLGHRLLPTTEAVLLAAVIAAVAWTLARRTRGAAPVSDHVTTSLICAAVLACVYHQTYDLLLLTPTFVALAARADCPIAGQSWLRRLLLALLILSAGNHLATHAVAARLGTTGALWLVIASWNGAVVLTVFLVYLVLAAMPPPRSSWASPRGPNRTSP